MSLFGLLEAYILTGVTGNLAYDVVRRITSQLLQKSPGELFLDSIDEAVETNQPSLQRFTRGGQVRFRRDHLSSLSGGEAVHQGLFASLSEDDVLDRLVSLFASHQLLEIGGHELTEETYAHLVRSILVGAKRRFRQKLSRDQVAFNEALLSQTEGNRALLLEIRAALVTRDNVDAQVLDEVRELRRDLQSFRLQEQSVAELESFVEPRTITQVRRVKVYVGFSPDLSPAERQSVHQTIRNLHLTLVTWQGQGEILYREHYSPHIAESDIFIGIYGGAYGQTVPGKSISRIHDEYELAAGKPRLIYVRASAQRDHQLTGLLNQIHDKDVSCHRTFLDATDLAELIREDVERLLSERFTPPLVSAAGVPVNRLAQLQGEMARRGLVERPLVVQDIITLLSKHEAVALVGEPGIGKTYLLGCLGKMKQAIYISLKGQTTSQVFAYLANRIRVLRGHSPLRLLVEDEARWQLENELQSMEVLLLIDDVDHNPVTAQRLLCMDRFRATAVFALRSPQPLGPHAVQIYTVPPFSMMEIRSFLSNTKLEVGPRRVQELRRTSRGNPLYLYYFSMEQVDPLPTSIVAYQEAIWRGLKAREKQMLWLLAISLFPRTADELHRALEIIDSEERALIDSIELLEQLSPIARLESGYFDVFHPFFAEFVKQKCSEYGLSEIYHRALGDIAVQDRRTVETAYHLTRAGDRRAQEYYGPAASNAFLWGYYQLAEEFMLASLKVAEQEGDTRELGRAHSELAMLYGEIGHLTEGKKHADTATILLHEAGDEVFAKYFEVLAAAIFLDLLEPDLAIQRAQDAVEYFSQQNHEYEAVVLVNLSNLFFQATRFKEGVEAAQRAYEKFQEQGDNTGIAISMTNIAACLGSLGDREQQRKLAAMIIDAAEKIGSPRLRAAGLNNLAICQRKDNQPDEARSSLEECISIAQELGDASLEAMNLNNLGNVYYDLHDFGQAGKCYFEALQLSRTHGITREEGRSHELLARIQARQRNLTEALKLAETAIELYGQIGDEFRIASTLEDMGWAYSENGEYEKAAKSYQSAAEISQKLDLVEDAAKDFDLAGKHWLQANEAAAAVACLHLGIEHALSSQAADSLASLLEVSATVESSKRYEEQYLELLRISAENSSRRSFADYLFSFTAYLKASPSADMRKSWFQEGFEVLMSHLARDANPNILKAIAVALEQADERLLDETSFESIAARLVESVDGLYRRELPDRHEVYTIGLRWETEFTAQIYCWERDLVTRRIALVIALVLVASRKLLGSQVNAFGGAREPGFILNVLTQSDFETIIMTIPHDQKLTIELPFAITESNVPWDEPQPESIALLHDDYAKASDWASHPNNKALVWLLMVSYAAFMAHTTHQKREQLARKAREFAEFVLE